MSLIALPVAPWVAVLIAVYGGALALASRKYARYEVDDLFLTHDSYLWVGI
jgi:hypothetical protein